MKKVGIALLITLSCFSSTVFAGTINSTPFTTTTLTLAGIGAASTTYVDTSIATAVSNKVDNSTYNTFVTTTNTNLATKASTTYVDTAVATKTNTTYVDTAVATKASTSYVDTAVAGKVDTSTYNTFVSTTNTTLAGKTTSAYVDSAVAAIKNPTEYPAGICAGSIILDSTNGTEQSMSLGANCTVTVPVSASGVKRFTVAITQNATTPYTLTLQAGSGGTFNAVGSIAMNTILSGRTILTCRQTSTFIDCAAAP